MMPASKLRILFVEDQPDDIELECWQLEREGLAFEWRAATSDADLRRALDEYEPDLVLCDYSIPGFSGRAALRIVREVAPEVPLIFVSGTIGEETAVECLREGATDYVLKGNPQRLGAAVRRALAETDERKAYEARIRHLANYDALTELPNRVLLVDRASQALAHARRTGRRVALVTLNLDAFRLVNEGFGHAVADDILRQVATRLRSGLVDGDTVARTGADEFTLLLSDLARTDDLHQALRRVREQLDTPYSAAGQSVRITASAGAAVFPADGEDIETLLRNAISAMHRAKAIERGGLQFCSADAGREALERLMMETSLSGALKARELTMHYQVKRDLRTGGVRGAEALMRWPRNASIGPGAFIRVAEEAGLIRPIGEWALQQACSDAIGWIRSAGEFVLAVNVSPLQLHDPQFAQTVSRTLEIAGLPPRQLELEMTEGTLVSTDREGRRMIERLRALGVKIAVDDFGTGYSSLSYLSRLPIDSLKIDISFIRRMSNDAREAAVVKSIVSLGHGLGLEVVAEGVENAEQVRALKAMECDQAQGFFFSRALPAEGLSELIDRESTDRPKEAHVPEDHPPG